MVRSLSNITNSLPNPKSHATVKKLPSDSASGKDFIDQLGKRWIIETCSRQKVLFFLISYCLSVTLNCIFGMQGSEEVRQYEQNNI
ncbi:Hypothetical predicted protein [Olea europaea subsp. europaea]|uniref:Uncharacterized protein n=1 Tax=Olea europaea subsp. europaea TaxID=158383 RepID=A0A8S0SRE9_OLEEU|nr:Hypothetical predicted protein [Olea europaea subsp. europaea]